MNTGQVPPIPIDMPQAPRTVEATGLTFSLIHNLVLKTLHFGGELTGSEVATRLGVGYSVVQSSLEHMKREHQCEILGGAVGPQSYT